MKKKTPTKFIVNAGGCIVSKNIMDGRGKLKWMVRKESVCEIDNGWRFFSDIDDDDYVNNPDNLAVCDFNTVAEIEPAIIGIFLMPVGSDLQLVKSDGVIAFYDNITEKEVKPVYEVQ